MEKKVSTIVQYEDRIFRMTVRNLFGDNVDIRIPVKAAKRLLGAAGRLPVMPKGINTEELAQLLAAAEDCLDAEMEGDIVNAGMADGTMVRIFIE